MVRNLEPRLGGQIEKCAAMRWSRRYAHVVARPPLWYHICQAIGGTEDGCCGVCTIGHREPESANAGVIGPKSFSAALDHRRQKMKTRRMHGTPTHLGSEAEACAEGGHAGRDPQWVCVPLSRARTRCCSEVLWGHMESSPVRVEASSRSRPPAEDHEAAVVSRNLAYSMLSLALLWDRCEAYSNRQSGGFAPCRHPLRRRADFSSRSAEVCTSCHLH